MRFSVLAILAVVLAGTAAGAATLAPAKIAARIVTGNGPCSEGDGFGALWVSNIRDDTIARIDPATNKVTGKVPVEPGSQPCGVVAGADALWIDGYGTGNVERVDPATMKVVAQIPIGPSLWDGFLTLLRNAGFATGTAEDRMRALVTVAHNRAHHGALWDLAEALIQHDQAWGLWRARHVLMAERQIGTKPGTGGSAGGAYLRSRLELRFYPELWEMRSRL